MTIEEFHQLDDAEKIAAAMQGDFVDQRSENGLKVALYSHPHFYAEVYYDGKQNQITRCRAFTSVRPLAAYIRLD